MCDTNGQWWDEGSVAGLEVSSLGCDAVGSVTCLESCKSVADAGHCGDTWPTEPAGQDGHYWDEGYVTGLKVGVF